MEQQAGTARRRGWVAFALAVAAGGYLLISGSGKAAPAPAAAAAAENTLARLDFTLKDMQGKEVRLADFKGRPLLVNFWATWCGPCKHEIPIFVELMDKYREDEFTVLGISTDDTAEDLRPFAAKYKMNYPVLVGAGHDDLIEAYEATFAIPVTWFIRRDGTVLAKQPGPATKEWFEAQVKALVARTERP